MSDRQPTLREAQAQVAFVLSRMEIAKEWHEGRNDHTFITWSLSASRDGVWYRYPRHRNFFFDAWPASDITERCSCCGDIIQDRRDGVGLNGIATNTDKETYATDKKWAVVCIRCYNKIRPQIAALDEWNETRLAVNRTRRSINEYRKNSR